VKKYDEAAKWLNQLLNEVSLKKFPFAHLEAKLLLALQYCLLNDYDLFHQLINSIQRQIRLLSKEKCEHLLVLSKILKVSQSDAKKNKYEKIVSLVEKLNTYDFISFTPTLLVPFDEELVQKLASD
jgi:hypothetical protein